MKYLKWAVTGCLLFAGFNFVSVLITTAQGSYAASSENWRQVYAFLFLALIFGILYAIVAGVRKLTQRRS